VKLGFRFHFVLVLDFEFIGYFCFSSLSLVNLIICHWIVNYYHLIEVCNYIQFHR